MPFCRALLISLLGANALASDLSLLTGKSYQGELQALSDKELVFTAPTGAMTVPLNQVLRVEIQPIAPSAIGARYTLIELVDGSAVYCAKYALRGKDLEVLVVGSDKALTIPLAAISSLLNEAQDAAVRQEWQEKILSKRGSQDVVAVKVNNVLNGIEGTLGEGNDKGEIGFSYDARGTRRERTIDPSLTFGLLFLRSLPGNAPNQLCKITDVNQNTYAAFKISLGSGSYSLTTITGIKVDLPKAMVARLDFSNDKLVYLSDLKPIEVVERSDLGLTFKHVADRNLAGTQLLQVKGELYSKGLALHAYTELAYSLDGKYRKFEAIAGPDDTVLGDGSPLLRIEADGKEIFRRAVTRKDEKVPIDLDVRGVRQLRIIVSSQRILSFGDHLDLVNARLSK